MLWTIVFILSIISLVMYFSGKAKVRRAHRADNKGQLLEKIERLAEWPVPKYSANNDVVLSSDLFNKIDRVSFYSSSTFSLIFEPGICDFDFVRKGQLIGTIKHHEILVARDYPLDIKVYAHCDGYVVNSRYAAKVNGILARIFDSVEEGVEAVYPFKFNAIANKDDFDAETVITMSSAYHYWGSFWVSFEYSKGIVYLKLESSAKQIPLSKGDGFDFLFSDTILHFSIDKAPVRNANDSKRKICYIVLSQGKLDVFKTQRLSKIRYISDGQEAVILNGFYGTPKVVSEYYIGKMANVFCDKLADLGISISDVDEQPLELEKDSSCFVYIMKDETNGAHKIGISNKPEYREKTLQSDKPYIVLLQAKEFPSRTIARAFESALHKTYESKHLRGEWFNLSEDEVHEVVQSLK